METILNEKDLKMGETIKLYLKNKQVIEGIVDYIDKEKIRLIGVNRTKKYFRFISFKNMKKIVDPGFDLILPENIIEKSNVKNKQSFETRFIEKNKKVKIKDVANLLNVGKKVRYFYPTPKVETRLYSDCILVEIKRNFYIFETFNFEVGKNFHLWVNKDSDAKIQFLNKNVKVPAELVEVINRISKKDSDYFNNVKAKVDNHKGKFNTFIKSNNEHIVVENKKKKQTKKEVENVKKAIDKRKEIKDGK